MAQIHNKMIHDLTARHRAAGGPPRFVAHGINKTALPTNRVASFSALIGLIRKIFPVEIARPGQAIDAAKAILRRENPSWREGALEAGRAQT